MKKFLKKLLIKSTAILCSAMLLFMSPYAGYLGASNMEYVQAIELAVAEGGIEIIYIIFAILSAATGTVVYANHEAIEDSFTNYLESPKHIDIPRTDTCMQVYNSNTNTITDISWQSVLDSLHEFHDEAVDDLTGIYVKYCPQLLDICYDFVGDVIDGEIYVPGISNTITEYANITEEDIKKQRSGELYTASFVTHSSCIYTNPYYHYTESRVYHRWFDVELSSPIAAVYNTSVSVAGLIDHNLDFYKYDSRYIYLSYQPNSYSNAWVDGVQTQNNSLNGPRVAWGLPGYATYSNNQFACFGNIPIFSSREAMETYFRTGEGYENALNYGISVYDDIESTATLPPFHKEWIQELLNKINNSPGGIGIGSYGQGISAENWIDHIPWLSLNSLREYYRSLNGIYRQMLDDIINGNYDSDKGIPGTYSEAWEQTISEAWDNVEQSTEAVPDESEKDKPTDEDEDKDDPEGGGGSGDSNNEDDIPDLKDIIDKIPDELKAYGKCDGFAQSLVNALEESGIAYKIIRVSSETLIYSDKFGSYIGVRYHYGVQVGDTVYDNLTTYGMLLDAWLEDLGLTQGLPGISWDYVIEVLTQ